MNTAQISPLPKPIVTNLAQAEMPDFVHNEATIHSFDEAVRNHANSAPVMREELWPFTVKIVSTPEELAKAVKLRHDAYAKHLPEVAAKLLEPEDADQRDIVLLVESKFDGSALGTMRIRTNATSQLPIESVIDVPKEMRGRKLCEATRLAIKGAGGSRMVRDALFKGCFATCDMLTMDFMLVGARKPVDRVYEWMGFSDVNAEGTLIPLPYAGNIPHRVMYLERANCDSLWMRMEHPFYNFFRNTVHPDLQLTLPKAYQAPKYTLGKLAA